MSNIINLFNNSKTKIIEDLSFNGRSILAAYMEEYKSYVIILFHISEQPNEASKHSLYSTWGYGTAGIGNISTREELDELTKMYIDDMLAENFWWEKNDEQ